MTYLRVYSGPCGELIIDHLETLVGAGMGTSLDASVYWLVLNLGRFSGFHITESGY